MLPFLRALWHSFSFTFQLFLISGTISFCVFGGWLCFQSAHDLLVDEHRYQNALRCYMSDEQKPHADLQYFPFLMDAGRQEVQTFSETMYFHETSCSVDGTVDLTARQACAIESAAKQNPGSYVFVLFASPRGIIANQTLPRHIQTLLDLPNVYFRNIELWRYAADTTAEDWLRDEQLMWSQHSTAHVSDFLRYMTLFLFPGTHLDLDMVVMKPLDALPFSFVGVQENYTVAAGIMRFGGASDGRTVATKCLERFMADYDGDNWAKNGPGVITQVLKQRCGKAQFDDRSKTICDGFTIYPSSYFYPIKYQDWRDYFRTDNVDETMEKVKESYTIHVWNHLSKNKILRTIDDTAYTRIARSKCPSVFETIGEFF